MMRPICFKEEDYTVCKIGEEKIINLLHHPIIIQINGKSFSIPKSGKVLRLKEESEEIGKIAMIPVVNVKFNDMEWEPRKKPNTRYIVSPYILMKFPRDDFIAPDISEAGAVRGIKGDIIGSRRFLKELKV